MLAEDEELAGDDKPEGDLLKVRSSGNLILFILVFCIVAANEFLSLSVCGNILFDLVLSGANRSEYARSLLLLFALSHEYRARSFNDRLKFLVGSYGGGGGRAVQ